LFPPYPCICTRTFSLSSRSSPALFFVQAFLHPRGASEDSRDSPWSPRVFSALDPPRCLFPPNSFSHGDGVLRYASHPSPAFPSHNLVSTILSSDPNTPQSFFSVLPLPACPSSPSLVFPSELSFFSDRVDTLSTWSFSCPLIP